MATQISYEKNVSIDDVINEAAEIWDEMSTAESPEKAIEAAQEKHKSFCSSYPLVVRFAAYRQYDSRAFRKYLIWVRDHPWSNKDEYFATQAKYVVLLYKVKNPHWNRDFAQRLQEEITKSLQDEYKTFTDLVKSIEEKVETEEEKRATVARDELRAQYEMFARENVQLTGEIRVITE